MGYITNEIAKIEEPKMVSLAANPNFVVFESTTKNSEDEGVNFDLQILNVKDVAEGDAEFEFIDSISSIPHVFRGTDNQSRLDNTTFHINRQSAAITAENIRKCLLADPFFSGNFNITIQPVVKDNALEDGTVINITSKGSGKAFTFKSFKVGDSNFINIDGNYSQSLHSDSILGEDESCEIQLDIHKDTNLLPGIKDYTQMGTYATTLSKSYFGQPLWFDVNTIWTNANTYSDDFLKGEDWCNTGTLTDFRFIAKRFNGMDTEAFYHSDVLFALTGYERNLEKNDLSKYVYNVSQNNEILPLTRQPILTHIRGQKQYFNFILSDPDPDPDNDETQCKLGILYEAYNQANSYLGKEVAASKDKKDFEAINTACLDIDAILDKYPKAGIVRVYLCRYGKIISKPLTYKILPQCLYKVHDFAFLNSLGGWSSFNFGGTEQTDFKSDSTTIHRTQTPNYSISSRIESVFNKEVTEQFIAQTSPITREVAEWLKEISSSVAVYELSTKRYVIVDELNVKHNSKDDLFTLQMKYHYSDSYNARIK